jgi:hypothetical protein
VKILSGGKQGVSSDEAENVSNNSSACNLTYGQIQALSDIFHFFLLVGWD